jgi:O-antigen polymerase
VELPFYMSGLHWFVFIVLLVMVSRHQVSNITKNITLSLARLINVMLITLFIVLMAFFAHTLRSNWDFVAFYKGKQIDNPLPYAYKNPYLSEQARWVDMNAMLSSSIKYGQKENVRFYVDWAENTLLERPDLDLYIMLIGAYQFLGNKLAFCETANRGLALYPQDEKLNLAKGSCL